MIEHQREGLAGFAGDAGMRVGLHAVQIRRARTLRPRKPHEVSWSFRFALEAALIGRARPLRLRNPHEDACGVRLAADLPARIGSRAISGASASARLARAPFPISSKNCAARNGSRRSQTNSTPAAASG